jgi:ADP-heptose:LPS heptosyltransferase
MMDSEWLRSLDKNIGQPVCFLFSLLTLFKRKNKDTRIKNILVLELFEMGAAVMAYPSLRCLQKNYPQVNIYCLCTDSVREAWEVLNVVPRDHILSVESKDLFRFGRSLLRRIVQLRKIQIDLLIDLGLFMRIPSMVAFMIGAKLTSGFNRYEMEGLYRGNHYDYPVAFNQNTHIAKNFLALTLAAINKKDDYPHLKSGIDLWDYEFPRYRSNGDISAGMKRKLQEAYPDYQKQQIILVCPDVGRNLSVRNYPRELYARAIKSILLNKPDDVVLLIGTMKDRETCGWIADEVGHKQCIDFSGRTATLTELLELIHLASLLIGNDNGPLHFASMTACKILALFSTDSPFVYGPLGNCVVLYQFYQCSPCISAFNHKHTRCIDNQCLKTLHPDLVSDYAVRLLEDRVSYHTCSNSVPYLF